MFRSFFVFARRLAFIKQSSSSKYALIAAASGFTLFTMTKNHHFPACFAQSPELDSTQSKAYQTFASYASLDYNGVPYMSPRDFIRCASGIGIPHYGRRIDLEDETISEYLKSTPSLGTSNRSSVFRDLDCKGIISYNEYIFLLSLVTNPITTLHIAFKMFDRNYTEKVDFDEFVKIIKILSQYYTGDFDALRATDATTNTTLLRHLFGKYGRKKLNFKDFANFIETLQTELMRVEFAHYAAGTSTMRPNELADSLLERSNLSDEAAASARKRLTQARHLVGRDPSLRFAYWSRYVARILGIRPVYRKELLGWRIETNLPYKLPNAKKDEYAEERFLPVWHFSEQSPWNIANRLSELAYPNLAWCVIDEKGRGKESRLNPISPDEQLIFKGDPVQVLVGPDKGKIGLVSAILKVRHMVIVDGLNYRLVPADRKNTNLRREEKPLKIDTEVALIDPSDNQRCSKVVWRYLEDGKRVRVSIRTGTVIPLPEAARVLDDLIDPVSAVDGQKDTPTDLVNARTFDPSLATGVDGQKAINFEQDLTQQYQLPGDPSHKRLPTFWY